MRCSMMTHVSVSQDSRTVLKDVITPALRAMTARWDTSEKHLNRVDRLVVDVNRRPEKRPDGVLNPMRQAVNVSLSHQRSARHGSEKIRQTEHP